MNVKTEERPLASLSDQPERDELLRLYRMMLLIRHFEERAESMYLRSRIGGYFHVNIGEEAAVVGAVSTLRPTDYLFSTYREHGHAMARGTDPRAVMAELFGKETGTSKGRGGSMHIFDAQRRFMGGWGIVGQSIPLAVGAAFATKYQGTDEAVMCIFGDGATNSGPFYESLNLARLWKLPIAFVCFNNLYGMGTSVERASSVTEIWRKGASFDVPGRAVDGMDVLATREVCRAAMEAARRQEPWLIEVKTYRYRGHSVADQVKTYRTEDEIKRWRERDPLVLFQHELRQRGYWSDEIGRELDAEVNEEISAALAFAQQSPEPSVADLDKYVYADEERSPWPS